MNGESHPPAPQPCVCVLFIIGDWNAIVGSQETPGVTGKFGLGIRNEAGQRLIEFCEENVEDHVIGKHQKHQFFGAQPSSQSNSHIHT